MYNTLIRSLLRSFVLFLCLTPPLHLVISYRLAVYPGFQSFALSTSIPYCLAHYTALRFSSLQLALLNVCLLFKALCYPGFDLHRLPFRLLALTVFVAWFGHSSLPYHVFVMLTHVQTLLNQSYRFSWTMVQYVLRIVLRFCLIPLCFTLYPFLAWLFIRVFHSQAHLIYKHEQFIRL